MDAPVSSGGVEEHEPERSLPWDHPWGHTLRPEIEAMIYEEPTDLIQVSKTLRDAYERGQREGLEEGIAKGVQQMLRRLFAKRLHRSLTARERRALAARAALAPDEAQDKGLALEGEALAAWLLAPTPR
jgi:flagellar biosynthesis/type III secretory pathway protein FliH